MRVGMIIQPILLLSIIHTTSAFVYSCEQVRYHLANSKLEHETDMACVVPQEDFTNIDQLKKIYLQNGAFSSSFAEIITRNKTRYGYRKAETDEDELCVRKIGAKWTISADSDLTLNCSQEFTIIFKSYSRTYVGENWSRDQGFVLPMKKDTRRTVHHGGAYGLSQFTAVVPKTGMWVHMLNVTCNSTVELWSGPWNDADDSFKISSWPCSELPNWIISFDSVFTLLIRQTFYRIITSFEFSSDLNGNLTVAQGDKIFLFTSGRRNDLQNLKDGVEHRTRFNFGKNSEIYEVDFKSKLIFDSKNNGSVKLRRSSDEQSVSYLKSDHNTDFNTSYFEVEYAPTGKEAQDIGRSQDHMLIEIMIGKRVVTTPAPTTTTMSTTTTTIATSEGAPYCNCELTDTGAPRGWNYNEIWLDIVVILDTSEAMGKQGLEDAGALVESFLSDGDTIDFLVTDPLATYYSRVGVISMAANATILYDLNMTKSDRVQGKAVISDGITNINVIDAFEEALKMFERGSMNNTYRNKTRRVIYYITDSDPKNNLNPVNQFKASKGVIIVNHFIQEGEVELAALQELASDGYYFKNDHYDRALQSFCKANCFCTREKNAYRVGDDVAIIASGGCYHAASAGVPYNKARITCERGNGILASIHDVDKEEFVRSQMADADSKFFWIGYRKAADGDWKWADNSTVAYDSWSDEAAHDEQGNLCAYAKTNTTVGMEWGADSCLSGFPYVCEYPPCSVGFDNC